MSRGDKEPTPREIAFDQVRVFLRERLKAAPGTALLVRQYHKRVIEPIREFLAKNNLEQKMRGTYPPEIVPLLKHTKQDWDSYAIQQNRTDVVFFTGFYREIQRHLETGNISLFDGELWQMILAELPDPSNN